MIVELNEVKEVDVIKSGNECNLNCKSNQKYAIVGTIKYADREIVCHELRESDGEQFD